MRLLKIIGIALVLFSVIVPGCSKKSRAVDRTTVGANSPETSVAMKVRGEAVSQEAAGSRPVAVSDIQRKVIKTADIELSASDIKETGIQVEKIVESFNGYILNSEFSSEKRGVVSTLVLKVPAARFTDAVETITKLGTVKRKDIRGEDVTEEYVDLEADLTNALRVQARYFELLSKAAKVSDALEVERELERIGGEIERIKGRMKYIDSRVALSTINLTLRQSGAPPITDFGHGLGQTLKILVRFLVVVFYFLVFLIGLAIPVALVWFIVRLIIKRVKH